MLEVKTAKNEQGADVLWLTMKLNEMKPSFHKKHSYEGALFD